MQKRRKWKALVISKLTLFSCQHTLQMVSVLELKFSVLFCLFFQEHLLNCPGWFKKKTLKGWKISPDLVADSWKMTCKCDYNYWAFCVMNMPKFGNCNSILPGSPFRGSIKAFAFQALLQSQTFVNKYSWERFVNSWKVTLYPNGRTGKGKWMLSPGWARKWMLLPG